MTVVVGILSVVVGAAVVGVVGAMFVVVIIH